jgi:hypothetical protein
MSEARIAVKIVNNRFVSCFPMPEPRPDEVTFHQQLARSSAAKRASHRRSPGDGMNTLLNYAQTREDQAA